jgi:hypothetical protein
MPWASPRDKTGIHRANLRRAIPTSARTIEKRREDACALQKLRETKQFFLIVPHKVLWEVRRLDAAFDFRKSQIRVRCDRNLFLVFVLWDLILK